MGWKDKGMGASRRHETSFFWRERFTSFFSFWTFNNESLNKTLNCQISRSYKNSKGKKKKWSALIPIFFEEMRFLIRGKFGFIKELGGYELIEGVENVDGEKTRGKWLYDPRKSEMKAVKMVKKCEYVKCSRDSSKSKRVFRLCGKCEKVFYCSRRHQRNDWEYHKYVCSYYRGFTRIVHWTISEIKKFGTKSEQYEWKS